MSAIVAKGKCDDSVKVGAFFDEVKTRSDPLEVYTDEKVQEVRVRVMNELYENFQRDQTAFDKASKLLRCKNVTSEEPVGKSINAPQNVDSTSNEQELFFRIFFPVILATFEKSTKNGTDYYRGISYSEAFHLLEREQYLNESLLQAFCSNYEQNEIAPTVHFILSVAPKYNLVRFLNDQTVCGNIEWITELYNHPRWNEIPTEEKIEIHCNAVISNKLDIVRFFIEKHPDIKVLKPLALFLAARTGRPDIAKYAMTFEKEFSIPVLAASYKCAGNKASYEDHQPNRQLFEAIQELIKQSPRWQEISIYIKSGQSYTQEDLIADYHLESSLEKLAENPELVFKKDADPEVMNKLFQDFKNDKEKSELFQEISDLLSAQDKKLIQQENESESKSDETKEESLKATSSTELFFQAFLPIMLSIPSKIRRPSSYSNTIEVVQRFDYLEWMAFLDNFHTNFSKHEMGLSIHLFLFLAANEMRGGFLEKAAELGQLDIVKEICQKSVLRYRLGNALYFSVYEGKDQVAIYLLTEQGKRIPRPNKAIALHAAAETGNISLVKKIMQICGSGIDNESVKAALTIAFQKGNLDIAKYLIEQRGNKDFSGVFDRSFHIAWEESRMDVAKYLLLKQGDAILPITLGAALHKAISTDTAFALRILQHQGKNISEKDLVKALRNVEDGEIKDHLSRLIDQKKTSSQSEKKSVEKNSNE